MAALDEPRAYTDQHQRDEHCGHSLGYERPGDLIQGQGGKRDHVSETDTASSTNTARSEGSDVTRVSSRNSLWKWRARRIICAAHWRNDTRSRTVPQGMLIVRRAAAATLSHVQGQVVPAIGE